MNRFIKTIKKNYGILDFLKKSNTQKIDKPKEITIFQEYFENFQDLEEGISINSMLGDTKESNKFLDWCLGKKYEDVDILDFFTMNDIIPEKFNFSQNSMTGLLLLLLNQEVGKGVSMRLTHYRDCIKMHHPEYNWKIKLVDVQKSSEIIQEKGELFCNIFGDALIESKHSVFNSIIYTQAFEILAPFAMELHRNGETKKSMKIFELCTKILSDLERDLNIETKTGEKVNETILFHIFRSRMIVCNQYCLSQICGKHNDILHDPIPICLSDTMLNECKKIIDFWEFGKNDGFLSRDMDIMAQPIFAFYANSKLDDNNIKEMTRIAEILMDDFNLKEKKVFSVEVCKMINTLLHNCLKKIHILGKSDESKFHEKYSKFQEKLEKDERKMVQLCMNTLKKNHY